MGDSSKADRGCLCCPGAIRKLVPHHGGIACWEGAEAILMVLLREY